MSSPSNKNDPRVIRTRKLIMDAFRLLGQDKDIDSISVKDIAEKATVNRATFYAHFEDKNALFDAIVYEEFLKLVLNRLDPEEGLTDKTLRNLILSMIDYNLVYYDCKRKAANISSLVDTKVQLQFQQILLSMLNNSSDCHDIPIEKKELLATIISSAIFGTTSLWATKQDTNKMKGNGDSIEELLLFLMSGIKALAH